MKEKFDSQRGNVAGCPADVEKLYYILILSKKKDSSGIVQNGIKQNYLQKDEISKMVLIVNLVLH